MLTQRAALSSTQAQTPAGTGVAARFAQAARTDEVLSKRTEVVLRELAFLPTLPAVATKLLELASRDDVEIPQIVRVIESDPAVTTRLLSLCRKAAYRTRYPVTTVEMAVVMLGLEAVRSLVLSVEIFDWCQKVAKRAETTAGASAQGSQSAATNKTRTKPGATSESKAGFNRVGFWQHSIAVACCADLIVREHPELELHPEEAFVAGLVHDLGKLALDLVLPKAYARVIELTEQRSGNIADFERPIVGLDHMEAGRTLAERWNLPDMLMAAMSQHHLSFAEMPDQPWRPLVAVVNLADVLCRKLALGWSGNHSSTGGPEQERELCAQIGLNPERVLGVVPKLYEATSSRMRDLGLGDEPSQQLLIESILRANQRLGRVNQDLMQANLALELTQQELAESRALARLGQMTAGAAHEMNNPLTIISGRAQTLLSRVKDDGDRATARSIVEAANRLTTLIARLNRIASPPEVNPQPVELRPALEAVIRQTKDVFGERQQAAGKPLSVMGVKLTLADDVGLVNVDMGLLNDALGEVILNALEAGPRTRVEVKAQVKAGSLVLEVVDDGPGMSSTALRHAIDPFFSEKPAGRQSGLGLALAHRLISVMGGEIDLASRPGRGTTVTIVLPLSRPNADAAQAA